MRRLRGTERSCALCGLPGQAAEEQGIRAKAPRRTRPTDRSVIRKLLDSRAPLCQHASMPALSADWPEVKATAIATGSLKEAAEAHGVSYAATRQRAKRECWPVGQRPAKALTEARAAHHEQIQRANKVATRSVTQAVTPPVTRVTTAAQAAETVLARRKESSRLSLSRYAQRALATAATLPRGKLLAEAANVKAAAGAYAIAHPDPVGASGAPTITLNVGFLLDCQAPGEPAGEIRDIEAETVIEPPAHE